eukprot:m.48473 g.48473  ORF g.48473 m.48473 type:complete len:389 (+) comp8918_c0_seq1:97-1263(+)
MNGLSILLVGIVVVSPSVSSDEASVVLEQVLNRLDGGSHFVSLRCFPVITNSCHDDAVQAGTEVCVNLRTTVHRPKLVWLTLPGGGVVTRGIRTLATARTGDTTTQVVATVAIGRGEGENAAILVWAGDFTAMSELALPRWLQPPSTGLPLRNHSAIIIKVPRHTAPSPLDSVIDRLELYDSAVAEVEASTGESAFTVGGAEDDPTYGEISVEGALSLFESLGLRESDVLYDLGSGNGKVVLLAAFAFPLSLAVGIELDPPRHSLATALLRGRVVARQVDVIGRVNYLCGDAFSKNAFSGATVVYMLSNAFPDEIFRRFLGSVELMSAKEQELLRTIVTSRPIPTTLLKQFNLRAVAKDSLSISTSPRLLWVPTTWSSALPLRIYDVS